MTLEDLIKRVEDHWETFRRHKHLGQALDQSEKLTGGEVGAGLSPSSSASPSPGAGSGSPVVGRMYLLGSQNVDSHTEARIRLNTNYFTAVGIQADLTAFQFVVEEEGYYFINGQVSYDSPVADKLVTAQIYVNGNQVGYSSLITSTTSLQSIQVSFMNLLSVGSTIDLRTWHNCGVTEQIASSNPAITFLNIFKV